jgi:NitT/TauT family transport system substrate-binding protein
VALIAVLAGCGTNASSQSSAHPTLNVVLGWYADPESGGFFAAHDKGYYTKAGLGGVTLQSGGPQVSATQLVASGRAQLGITDATGVALARQQGIPVVAIAAMYQTNPVGMIAHADGGINSFKDMANHPWIVQTGQLGPEWVKRSQGISFPTQQYQGSIANFLHDKNIVQQGWPTNEVYQAQQAGVQTKFFSFADAGYNPYNDVIFTTQDYLKNHATEIRQFLQASMEGWRDYTGDVNVATATNKALLAANNQQSPQSVWFAWDKQRQYITSGEGKQQLGAMTQGRWDTLVKQMTDLGALTKPLNGKDLFDNSLLPQVAPTDTMPSAPQGSY